MINVVLDLTEWTNLRDRLLPLVQRPEEHRMFTQIANLLMKSWWGQTFTLQGARRGHARWAPLNPEYAAWKQRNLGHQRALLYHGHLMGSVRVLYRGPNVLDWGTDNPYARWHQDGVPGRLPKREMLFVMSSDVREMENFIALFVREFLGG